MQKEYLEYYSNYNEDQRLLNQNITRIEFDTTIHQLSPYIKNAKSLTELGAATGRYSLFYAQQGIEVTAVELVPELVKQLKEKSDEIKANIKIYEANATNVKFIEDASQDVVLILGPLYHIQNPLERESVLREANRILKPNGTVAIAYISRFFVAGLLAKMSGNLVTPEILTELNKTGIITSPEIYTFFRTGYFATPSEIEKLSVQCGFTVDKHVATDGFARYISDQINELSESQYQSWLQHHISTCAEPSLLGASNHGLVIAHKCG